MFTKYVLSFKEYKNKNKNYIVYNTNHNFNINDILQYNNRKYQIITEYRNEKKNENVYILKEV